MQRLGLVPASPEGLLEQLDEVDALFMVFQNKPLGRRQVKLLDAWMRKGGTVVVVEGFANPSPTANEWLERYGVRFDYGRPISGAVEDLARHRWTNTAGMRVHGGDGFLFVVPQIPQRNGTDVRNSDEGVERADLPRIPIAAVTEVGQGRLILVGLGDGFQDTTMGTTRVVPTEQQNELYELEFALLRTITGVDGASIPVP